MTHLQELTAQLRLVRAVLWFGRSVRNVTKIPVDDDLARDFVRWMEEGAALFRRVDVFIQAQGLKRNVREIVKRIHRP